MNKFFNSFNGNRNGRNSCYEFTDQIILHNNNIERAKKIMLIGINDCTKSNQTSTKFF